MQRATAIVLALFLTSCSSPPKPEEQQGMFADALRKRDAKIAAAEKRQALADMQAESQNARSTQDPLVEAAQVTDIARVKSLLAGGVKKSTLNEALLTVAHSEPLVLGDATAADQAFADTAALLLKAGASVSARDQYGNTPLILAASNGETGVARLLLDHGADIEATDQSGTTPLIQASCMCPIIDMPDTAGVVRLLLERGANIEARADDGLTPLLSAADWGRGWIITILLDKGAQLEAADKDGNTALLIAARPHALPMADAVKVLVTRGASVNATNRAGVTPLMLAAEGGDEPAKIVKLLLAHGADPRATDNKGRTARQHALAKHEPELAKLLP